MERAGVLVSCESQPLRPGISSEGLTCRINANTSVNAFWDAERQSVCCRVQQEVRLQKNSSNSSTTADAVAVCLGHLRLQSTQTRVAQFEGR